jgi:ADP-ribose pyrophosphatase YjhB (NUDIX family)
MSRLTLSDPVTTDRRFCRFNRLPETASFSVTEIPADGFCISAFLVLRDSSNPSRVLMGHLNPQAPWDHIGALDPSRVEAHRYRWMLPSSHLIYGETPPDAARRILVEQLELPPTLPLEDPRIFSEVGPARRFPVMKGHWDPEMIFMGRLLPTDVRSAAAWTDLAFVDMRTTARAEIARSHDEILDLVGLSPARGSS